MKICVNCLAIEMATLLTATTQMLVASSRDQTQDDFEQALIFAESFTKSNSNRTLEESIFNCKGRFLKAGDTLKPTEYIGPPYRCPKGGFRFGLNSVGQLGAWSDDGQIQWSPGVKGDYLNLKGSGNLVLLKSVEGGSDEVVWESDCNGVGSTLRYTGDFKKTLVELKTNKRKLVWGLYSNGQESTCYPGSRPAPTIKCRGDILASNAKLKPNEYICDRIIGQMHRFGLNARGRLALWHGNSAIWSPPWKRNQGDFLQMQTKGKIALVKKEKGSSVKKWASGCKGNQALLSFENGGVKITKRNSGALIWTVDEFGEELRCGMQQPIPKDDCTRVSTKGNICQVRMIDNANWWYVGFRAEAFGNGKFNVSDNFLSCGSTPNPPSSQWIVPVEVRNNGRITMDAGVPGINCAGMIKRYKMEDNSQLSFVYDDNYPCTAFGKNLIWFLIYEWFYFG